MTTARYQSRNPATMPEGLEIDTEDNSGATRQVVVVRNPKDGTLLGVDGSGATQPISATSLPLPTGAATSALQTSLNALLAGTGGLKFVDEAGALYGVKHVNNKPRVSSTPYLYDIAEGNVSNHTSWEKIGFTPTMTTTESPVWSKAGAYAYPAAGGIQMAVASSSATVDLAGGAGAQQVTIDYIEDTTFLEKSETVTLNATTGTTRVNTVASNIFRVNAFRVTRAGANGKPTGNISLTNTDGTVTYSYITATYTRARNSYYCVPAGKTLYIVQANLGFGHATNQTHYCRLYIRANQNKGVKVENIFYPLAEIISHGGTIPIGLEVPIKIVEKVDVFVGGISTVSGIATSILRGWLE